MESSSEEHLGQSRSLRPMRPPNLQYLDSRCFLMPSGQAREMPISRSTTLDHRDTLQVCRDFSATINWTNVLASAVARTSGNSLGLCWLQQQQPGSNRNS